MNCEIDLSKGEIQTAFMQPEQGTDFIVHSWLDGIKNVSGQRLVAKITTDSEKRVVIVTKVN